MLDEVASNNTYPVSLIKLFLLNNEIKVWMCKKLSFVVGPLTNLKLMIIICMLT